MLGRLGYVETRLEGDDPVWGNRAFAHPEGRKAIFLGDLVDRGPRILDTVRLVRNMVVHGSALCVPGNHDMKLVRKLRGKNVQITHGLADTLAEIDALPDDVRASFSKGLADFLDGLVSHYVLDDGKLVVAHAGMKEEMQGRGSGKVRDFALYGETTGETDEFGLPVRFDWAKEYRGSAAVVYGHTPVPEPEWLNRTVNIDTGCVFGGKLTALRYPEKEFVSVPAARTYCEPVRPFLPAETQAPSLTAQQAHDEVLDAEDVLGKRIIPTRLRGNVTIREENAAAALEVMSRFAADPRWLIYLPPTMSPCETSRRGRAAGAPGRGVRLLPRPGCPAGGLRGEAHGVAGRRRRLPGRGRGAGAIRRHDGRDSASSPPAPAGGSSTTPTWSVSSSTGCVRRSTAADLWSKLDTTWVCLDCELMPWSAKAQELLRTQYAAVGSAGLGLAAPGGRRAGAGGESPGRRREGEARRRSRADYRQREQDIERFVAAYRQYCWPVDVAGRPEAGPVSPAGHRGARPHRQGPPLAHGDPGRGLPGRPRTAAGDPVPGRGRDRPGEPGGGDRLVGGAHRAEAARGWWSSRWRSSTGVAGASPSPP